MTRLLAVAALLALAVAGAASGRSTHAPATVSSSRLVDHGHIRLTASIVTPVQAGHPLKVTYRFRNVSKVTRSIQIAYPSEYYVVRNARGVQFDTRLVWRGFGGPVIPPTKLRPGHEVTESGPYERVRWSGPLRITAGWADTRLPTLWVRVKSSGALASSRRAVAQVVAATGHLLDHCRPQVSGVSVMGRIDAPDNSAPPMAARCSVTVRRETGFDVAQVLISTPRARRARAYWTYETVRLFGAGGNAAAIAWQFVVTKTGATSVAAANVEETKQARKTAPEWEWTSAGPGNGLGGARCGGSGGGGGSYAGPAVEFVSKCR